MYVDSGKVPLHDICSLQGLCMHLLWIHLLTLFDMLRLHELLSKWLVSFETSVSGPTHPLCMPSTWKKPLYHKQVSSRGKHFLCTKGWWWRVPLSKALSGGGILAWTPAHWPVVIRSPGTSTPWQRAVCYPGTSLWFGHILSLAALWEFTSSCRLSSFFDCFKFVWHTCTHKDFV